jgi:hypothetical protein
MNVEDWFSRIGSWTFLATLALTTCAFFFARWATAVPNPHLTGEFVHAIRPRWCGWAFLLMCVAFAWGCGSLAGLLAARLPAQLLEP